METADRQCGFVERKGKQNAINGLRTLNRKTLQVQTDLYLCLIDYTKAFDNVKHEDVMKMLGDI